VHANFDTIWTCEIERLSAYDPSIIHLVLQSVPSFRQTGCRTEQFAHFRGTGHRTQNLVALFGGGLRVYGYCQQARNQLGTPGGAKSFLRGAQIF